MYYRLFPDKTKENPFLKFIQYLIRKKKKRVFIKFIFSKIDSKLSLLLWFLW
jgi:hypothetical protein